MPPNSNIPQVVSQFVVKNNMVYLKIGVDWYQFAGTVFKSTDPYHVPPVTPVKTLDEGKK